MQTARPTPFLALPPSLRNEAAQDRRRAALEEAKLDLEEREVAAKLRRHANDDAEPAEGLTFADFRKEVTLLGVERLPSAFERADGETLLYEGVANSIYGEPSTGKSWIALMATIQQLRAGRRCIWWDNEDRATTLAKRLQLLRATDLIGVENLAWRTGDLHESETAMAEALAFLDGGSGPGLVVIDSATSHGCPKDNADVQPWVTTHIKPWLHAGHTSLTLDHVPKQRKDRPAGAVGSYEKLSDIRGAALYVHGTAWNGQQGGAVHLTIHKDAHGQLPAPKFSVVSTITAEWDGPTLAYTVGLPDALAYVGGSRWRIETEFETEKSDVGLDEYETRTWAGWHHHVALCLLGGAFLLSLQQAWGEKDAPDHEAAGLPGGAGNAAPGTVRANRVAAVA